MQTKTLIFLKKEKKNTTIFSKYVTHFATKQILELEQDKLIQKHLLLYNCSIEIDMFSEIGSSCY